MSTVRCLTVASLVGMLALTAPLPALAQDVPSEEEIREQIDECLEGGPYPGGPPSCTFDGEGNLVDRDVPGEDAGGSGFEGLVVFALLWSLVPMVIAASVASSRGLKPGLAVLITLAFGWLGLFFLLYVRDGSLTLKADATDSTRERTSSGSVADEIRKLGELRDQGVLTEEEFRAGKARLLGQV